jgi:endonuclease YncB( thermonuclease family)
MLIKFIKRKIQNRRNDRNNISTIELLENIKDVKIPKFSLKGQEFYAKCVKVYDGDTCHLIFYYNSKLSRFICRMEGYNSAELKTKDENEKLKAIEAKNKLSEFILNKVVLIKCGDFELYGRLLATIYLLDENKIPWLASINMLMIEQGFGKEYNGRGEKNY